MSKSENIIGIDIIKAFFDTAWSDEKGYKTKKYHYDEAGIKAFAGWLTTLQKPLCVMESTCTYHLRLAHTLYQADLEVSVVNPLSAKRFIQSTLSRSKTDKADACRLVEYGQAIGPPLWKPTDAYYTQLQQLLGAQELYIRQRTAISNQLEATGFSPVCSPTLTECLNESLRHIDRQIEQIEREMKQLVDHNDPGDVDNLTSIPGIGGKTATALVAQTKGMKDFSSHRQLSAYFGLAPSTVQSGSSVRGTRRICKMGMGHIRKLLYICSWSAIKCNKACKELYNRLIEKGKAKKLALIAVANKLLKIAFAIIKSKSKYNKNYALKFDS
jgi:transposase